MRTLMLVLVLVVALSAAPGAAFAEAEGGVPGAAQVDPDTPVMDGGDGAGENGAGDGDADDACARGGADADYAYCEQEECVEGADEDYVYDVACFPGAAGGDPRPGGGEGPAARALPAAQLPLTGGEPLVIALFGAAFVLLGAGLRPRGAART